MVEFAIVLPLLLLLLLGIIEMGRAIMLNQIATNAAREGARQAVVPGATSANVTAAVNGYLDSAGVKPEGRTVAVTNAGGAAQSVENIPSKSSVSIQISFPYGTNTWGVTNILGGRTLSNKVTMRRE